MIAGWTETRLGHLVRFRSGDAITSQSIESHGTYPVFGGNGRRGYAEDFNVDGDSILVGRVGALCGNVHRYVGKARVSEHALIAYPLVDWNRRWMAYLLDSMNLGQWSTGTAQPVLTAATLERLRVIVPSTGTQARIADYLDRETATIDALIEKQQRMLELLHQRATAVTSQLVWAAQETESAVHGGLPEAPASWNVVRNKDLWRESKTVSVFGDEEPLSVSHITGVTRRSEKNVTMIEAESYVGYRIVEPGDLVINTMWAWMGALGVSELNGIVSPAYGVYRTTHPDLMDCRFFNRLYRTPEYVRYMESWSRGLCSSRLRLYPEVFLSLPVPVPPLEEQREIADHLDRETATIDALIAKAERFIELAQERRAALITAAVTGQIEIPT